MSKEAIRGAKQGILNTKNAKKEPRSRLFLPPHELYKTVMLNQASSEPPFILEQGVSLPPSYVVANYNEVLMLMPNLTSFSYLGTFEGQSYQWFEVDVRADSRTNLFQGREDDMNRNPRQEPPSFKLKSKTPKPLVKIKN